MDSRTLLLMLLGGGITAYLAYSLAKGGRAQELAPGPEQAPSEVPGDSPPYVVDTAPSPFGLGILDPGALCRVAPSLCGWFNPSYAGNGLWG